MEAWTARRKVGAVSNRELVVLGIASRLPTRRRNHNGYPLRWDAEGLLLDPGEGTQRQMQFAGVAASQISRICITHFHGDHCLGLPGVLQRMSLDEVTKTVEVCYPAQSAGVFARLRHAALYCESVSLLERPVDADGPVGGERSFRLEARQLSHSVPTFGYSLTEPDGRRMLPDKLAAAGIAGPDVGRLQRDGSLLAGDRLVTVEEVSELRPGQRFASLASMTSPPNAAPASPGVLIGFYGTFHRGLDFADKFRRPDHHPGAVAAEQVACELERQSRARVGGAFDQHQRRSFGDAERLSLPDARADWLQALLGPVRPPPVLLIEQLVQRPVQAVAEQARAAFGREQGVFDQDRLAACQAQPPYLVDRGAHVDLQRGCGGGAGAGFCCSN